MNKTIAWTVSFSLAVAITAIVFLPKHKTLTESDQVTLLGNQISQSEIKVRELRLEKQDLTNKLASKDKEILREMGNKNALEIKKNRILMSGLNYMQPVQIEKPVVIDTGVQKSAIEQLQEGLDQEQ